MEIEFECPACGKDVRALTSSGRVRVLYHWTPKGLPCRCIGPIDPSPESSPGGD